MLAGRCIPDSMFTRLAARNLWKLFAATSISRIHASDLSPSRSRLSRSRGRGRHPAGPRAPIVLPATCPNFHTRRLSNKVGTEDYSSADLRSTSIPEVSTLVRVLPFVERSAHTRLVFRIRLSCARVECRFHEKRQRWHCCLKPLMLDVWIGRVYMLVAPITWSNLRFPEINIEFV